MTIQMFYKKPIAIDRETHRNTLLKPLADGYSFAASNYSIPLAVVEFAQAGLEYPIVFAVADDGNGMPVAMTGLREAENLFVTPALQWDAGYIPAFVRRYPFVLQKNGEGQDFLLLVDAEYPGFGAADGERLFDEDGKDTPMLSQLVEFLMHCHNEAEQSAKFVTRLKTLDILVPQSVDVKTQEGAVFTLQGFYVVDHERLMALPDATLLELARSGDLAQIYAHLVSLGNLQKLVHRLEARLAPAAST